MRVTEKEEATLRTAMVRNYRIGIVTQIGIKSGHFFFFRLAIKMSWEVTS